MPDFKEKIRPIEALLSPKGPGEWTAECTAALNDILRVVEQRITLAMADPYGPMDVFVSVGTDTGLAIITQHDPGGATRVVALISRGLTAYEKNRPPLEQKLHIARWALHRCRRFTTTSPAITVHVPEPEHLLVLRDRTHHLRVEALLVDMASYKVSFNKGDELQQLWAEVLEGAVTG